jgi:hypothetical protein
MTCRCHGGNLVASLAAEAAPMARSASLTCAMVAMGVPVVSPVAAKNSGRHPDGASSGDICCGSARSGCTEIRCARRSAAHHHDLGCVAEPDAVGVARALPRGNPLGGCSSTHNTTFALRRSGHAGSERAR